MILTIDAGNTDVTFALMKDGKVEHSWRAATSNPDLETAISKEMESASLSLWQIRGGILASVVPAVIEPLQNGFQAFTGKKLLTVGQGHVDLGIEIKTDKPEEVGADRLINAIAGAKIYGPPLIIIDIGTATTFDVVGTDGSFRGGIICAGVNMALKALHEQTAKLPEITVYEPDWVAGRNTIDAMQSGAFFGTLGQIEGLVKRLRVELGGKVKTVATGGLSGHFIGRTDAIDHHHPDLTLQGLRLVYEQNEGRAE